jgi:hypothetical protein
LLLAAGATDILLLSGQYVAGGAGLGGAHTRRISNTNLVAALADYRPPIKYKLFFIWLPMAAI